MRLCVLARNRLGAWQTTPSQAVWIVDTIVPTLTVNTPAYVNLANQNSYPLSGTCSENGRDVLISGAASATAPCTAGTWSATLDMSALGSGVHTLAVAHTDATGNSTTLNQNVTKDTAAPPALSDFSAAPHPDMAGIKLSLTYPGSTADYASLVTRQLGGATAPAATCDNGTVEQNLSSFSTTSFDVTGLTPGLIYSFRVCIYDAAGNLTATNTATSVKASGQKVWNFSTAGDYTFDNSLIGVSGGFASLAPVDQVDHDNTAFGFAGGIHFGTVWDGTSALTLNASAVASSAAIPNNFFYGIDTTGLVFLTQFDGDFKSGSYGYDKKGRHAVLQTGDSNWKSVVGKSGKALYFDGNDYYPVGDHPSHSFAGDFTLMAWIKTTSGAGAHRIISKQVLMAPAHLYLLRVLNKKVEMEYKGANGTLYAVAGTTDVDDGKWHHVVGLRRGTSIVIYVDGKMEATVVAANDAISPTTAMVIGRDNVTALEGFIGTIDEVAMFNRALSEPEIATMYQTQVARVTPSAWLDGSSLQDGLIYLAHLDETSGVVQDASGLNNHGAENGGVAFYQSGQVGASMFFDGSNDYVNAGLGLSGAATENVSISVWIKPTAYGIGLDRRMIVNQEGEFEIGLNHFGHMSYGIANTSPGWNWVDIPGTIPLNTWSHFVLTYSQSSMQITAYLNGKQYYQISDASGLIADALPIYNTFRLGHRTVTGDTPYYGYMDEVAVWNKPLTSQEVEILYHMQKGGHQGNVEELPAFQRTDGFTSMTDNVLLMRLNNPSAGEGSFIQDYSGSNNRGTLLTGSDGLEKAINGHLRGALTFDGSDAIKINDAATLRPASDISYGGWFKWDGTAGQHFILSKSYAGNASSFALYVNNGNLHARIFNTGATHNTTPAYPISSNTWYHAVVTHDGTTLRLYLNGNLVSTPGALVTRAYDSSPLFIGGEDLDDDGIPDNAFTGAIDEVAVWNRLLSATDIKTIYERQSASYLSIYESRLIDIGREGTWSNFSFNIQDGGYAYHAAHGNDLASNQELRLSMNDGGDCTTITDTSGQGHNGTNQGASCVTSGPFGSALSFKEAENDYVDFGDVADIGTGDFTVSLWVKTTDTNYSLISKSFYGVSSNRWGIFDEGFGVRAAFTSGGSAYATGMVSISDGRWHQVGAVYDRDGDMRLYIDGIAVSAVSIASLSAVDMQSTFNLFLGRYNDGATGTAPHPTLLKYTGLMDEVVIFRRALSESEMNALYQRGISKVRFQVRACNVSGCDDEPWQGVDGTSSSFLSEFVNTSATTNVFPFSSFGSMSVSTGRFFQYRALLGTDSSSDIPKIANVTMGPSHYYHQPSVTVNTGIAYTQLRGFEEVLGSGTGSVTYQLSKNGTTWWYYNGTSWTNAFFSSQSSSASVINANASSFHTIAGTGTLQVRAFLNSPTNSEQIELDEVKIRYVP